MAVSQGTSKKSWLFCLSKMRFILIHKVLQQLKHMDKSNASHSPVQNTISSLILSIKSENLAVQPAQLSHNHSAAFGVIPTTLPFLQDRIHFSCTTAGCCFGKVDSFGATCTSETPLECDGGWWLAPPPPAGSPPPDPFHDDWPFW